MQSYVSERECRGRTTTSWICGVYSLVISVNNRNWIPTSIAPWVIWIELLQVLRRQKFPFFFNICKAYVFFQDDNDRLLLWAYVIKHNTELLFIRYFFLKYLLNVCIWVRIHARTQLPVRHRTHWSSLVSSLVQWKKPAASTGRWKHNIKRVLPRSKSGLNLDLMHETRQSLALIFRRHDTGEIITL